MTTSAPITERRYVVPLVLVTSLFFLWAIGVNLNDILIQHFKKAFALTDFRIVTHPGCVFRRLLPGRFARGMADAAGRLQTRNPDRAAGLRHGSDSVYSSGFSKSLWIFPLRSLRDGMWTVGSRGRRQSVRYYAWSDGEFGTQAESRAIFQRRGRRAGCLFRLAVYSFRHRAHSGPTCGYESLTAFGLSGVRSLPGQDSLFSDHRGLPVCRAINFSDEVAGDPRDE